MRPDRNNSVAGGSVAGGSGGSGRSAANRVDDDRLLDAVRSCVLAVGVRRTTLTDVAKRAGVSRMTLYRRFPDVGSLVTALMAREFGGLLTSSVAESSAGDSARAMLVSGTLGAIRHLSENPVMNALLDRDPDLLLPYVMERIGRAQTLAEQYITEFIVSGHADGSIRRAQPATQARVVLLIAQTFVFSLRPASSDVDSAELLAELGHQLDGALAPGDGR